MIESLALWTSSESNPATRALKAQGERRGAEARALEEERARPAPAPAPEQSRAPSRVQRGRR